jgi:hypothetical protein
MTDNIKVLRLFYDGPDGRQTNQAQIPLTDAVGKTLSWIVCMIRECFLILIPTPAASAKRSYLLRNEKPIIFTLFKDDGSLTHRPGAFRE